MRQFLCLVAILVGLGVAAPASHAAEYVDQSAVDELFAALKHAQTPAEADEISHEIWEFWLHPDVADLDRRMQSATGFVRIGDYPHALALLSQIIHDFPDYAEGWNQRATLYFMMRDDADSLSDIAKVLELEPRHFGALSGRAMIYLKEGKRADALRDINAALSLNPYLNERKLFPELAPQVTYL